MFPIRDSQPSNATPVVTFAIILVNVLVFGYEISLDEYSRNHFVHTYGMVPDRFQLSTLVTSMFLHGGLMHLLGNMWFLWIFGDNVEDILGRWKYLLFYLASGVAASLVHLAFFSESRVPTVGASGAIAGVMGAYMLKFPHSRIVTIVPVLIFFTQVELPAFFLLILWFGIQILSGVVDLGRSVTEGGGVAWFAHVGGFIAGVALIAALQTRERYRLRPELRW